MWLNGGYGFGYPFGGYGYGYGYPYGYGYGRYGRFGWHRPYGRYWW